MLGLFRVAVLLAVLLQGFLSAYNLPGVDRMRLHMQSAPSVLGADLPKMPRVGQALVAEVSDIGGSMSAPMVKFISRDHTSDMDMFMPAASLSAGTPMHYAPRARTSYTIRTPSFLLFSPSLTSRLPLSLPLSLSHISFYMSFQISNSREAGAPDRHSDAGAGRECAGHSGGGEHRARR